MGYIKLHGQSIPIDRELMYIIKTLNEKGYTTDGCCAGHWMAYYPLRPDPYQYGCTYIGFFDEIPPLDYIQEHLKDIGINDVFMSEARVVNKLDLDYFVIHPNINCFRFHFNNNPSDRWHKSHQRAKMFRMLTAWVNGLPHK